MAKEKSKVLSSWAIRWAMFRRVLMLALLLFSINFFYQVYSNPLHLLSFLSRPFSKTPQQTWETYKDVFERAAVGRVTAPLIAAIAQVESQGNPLAAPTWTLQMSSDLKEVYAPASSAFGIMQITKGTFERMQRICSEMQTCSSGNFSTRMRATDSIGMVAHYLHSVMTEMLGNKRVALLRDEQVTELASVIHLCGPEVGGRLVQNRFRLKMLSKCGAHWPQVYTNRVMVMKKQFEAMSKTSHQLASY